MTALDHAKSLKPPDRTAISVSALIVRWQRDGDRAARDEMVRRFMPMARKLANRYRNANEPIEDLVQVASLGLLGAIDRYDPSNEAAFSSFAVPTILGELKRHFRDTGWSVHVPRSRKEMALRVDQAITQLRAQEGRTPTLEAVAEHLNVSIEDALDGFEASAAHYATSYDAHTSANDLDDGATLADVLGADDDLLDLVVMSASLSAAAARLPLLERRALALRVQHDMKQAEIGKTLGCSQMQVSRLLARAACTLRAFADLEEPDPPKRRNRSPTANETIG